MISQSYFIASEIETFFKQYKQPIAASHWHKDMMENKTEKEVSNKDAYDWFKKYFSSEKSYYMFRIMECNCVQRIDFNE
jgi:hypothetical protein